MGRILYFAMPRILLLAMAAGVAVSTASIRAQGPKLEDVVARIGEYVLTFEMQMAAVVAEETYVQTLDQGSPPGTAGGTIAGPGGPGAYGPGDRRFPPTSRNANKRTLRSDYALTKADDSGTWIGYRDTFEVDGRSVRDREERLQRLLTTGGSAQAQRISEQNARFNLAEELLSRTVNVPTFALALLHPRYQGRFSAKRTGIDTIEGRTVWEIEFRERDRPTIVRTPERRDQPTRVVALVDPANGTVWRTTVTWEKITGSIVVTYGYTPAIPVPVPLAMSERYTTRGGSKIGGEATYTNYRRFQTSGRVISP
jgi:hypothetical protein